MPEKKEEILNALSRLDLSSILTAEDLAAQLRGVASGCPLPQSDINPDFGKLDGGSREERERMYQEYLRREERRFQNGKRIVYGIAIVNVVICLWNLILNPSFGAIVSLVIQIVLSVCLCAGYPWARWLFVAGAGLGVLGTLASLPQLAELGVGWPVYLGMLTGMAIALLSAVPLLVSKSVRDFLDSRRDG